MFTKATFFVAVITCLTACKGKQETNAGPAEAAFERARIKLEQTYNDIDSFSSWGIARVSTKDSATFVDSTGKLFMPFKYLVQSFSEGLAYVQDGEDGPKYFIDSTGKKMFDVSAYRNAFYFINGYSVVANKDGLYGMIDRTGKEVVPCIYEEGPQWLNGDNYAVSLPNEGKKIINIKGGTALPVKDFKELYYDEINNKYALSNNDGWYLLNDKGAVIKKMDAGGVLYPRGDMYIVNRDSTGKGTEWALLDGEGNFVVPYGKYNSIDNMSEGLACVGIETNVTPSAEAGISDVHQKVGYIDKTGKEVIPLQFEDIMQPFSYGLAPAMQKGKIGYIDKTGAWVIQPKFDKAVPFSRGYAKVTVEGNTYYIDKNGNRAL